MEPQHFHSQAVGLQGVVRDEKGILHAQTHGRSL